MNPASAKEAEKLFLNINKGLINKNTKNTFVICPPFLYLEKLIALNRKGRNQKITFGAQDVFWEESGAYTGKISASMLSGVGVKYVILGHSELRALGENNFEINKKIKKCFSNDLIPILCIGEKERDEKHEYFNFIKIQIKEALNNLPKNLFKKIIIAYEPIWAISSTAQRHDVSPNDISEMVIFIRKILSEIIPLETAYSVPIIYGGSVNEKNILDLMQNGKIDGVLVGQASLDSKKFLEIISKV